MSIPHALDRLATNESATVPTIFRHLTRDEDVTTPTILVIDDNSQISYLLAKKLLPRFGYKALQARTGKEGLEIIRKFRPDLILLDLQLPDMDGLDVLRELAKEDHMVPAILMTAHGSEQVAADAFRLGVQGYFSKPVDPDGLEQAIARILSQKNLQEEQVKLTSQLEEQVARLRTFSRVGQSVTSTLEIDEVLRRIVEAGVYLTKAEEGFIALIDEQSGQLYLRASKNIEEQRTRTTRLLINDSMIGEVIKTGKPIRFSTKTDYPSLKVSTGYLVSSLLHVPILSKGKILGVLSVDHRHNSYNFLVKDEAMLTSLADYAAIAIENANLYEQSQKEISERIRAETALRESDERYSLAVKGTNDGIWDWDLITHHVYYSPRWKTMLGYNEEEICSLPKAWLDLVHIEDHEHLKAAISAHLKSTEPHFEHEHRMLRKDGTYCWVLTRGVAVRDVSGKPYRMAGSQSDTTDRKNAEERLIYNAFYDTLSGLPNRALLLDRLKQAILRKKRFPDKSFSILYLDLDNFKNINDSLGHAIGDQFLVSVAEKLKASLRPMDTVARLGGDEFIILLEDTQDMEKADEIAQRILESLSKPGNLNGHEIYVTASIGIISGDMEYDDPEQLLRDADIAMYSAKSHGRGRYEIFNLDMRTNFLAQISLESELTHAIQNNELRLTYQPIVSLKTGALVGFEALVRWEHSMNGYLYPKDFLFIAEKNMALSLAIDGWVLHNATCQLSQWLTEFPVNLQLAVSVNLSAKYLRHINVVEEVRQILKKTGLEGSNLNLEITESGIMENSQHIMSMMDGLRAIGVDIHIDDFGSGYSSLAYLHQFQVQALKIDRSFISNPNEGKHMSELVKTVLHLARDLQLEAIAEGVETKIQLEKLQKLGCDYGQGFLFSQALDANAAKSMLGMIHAGQNPFAHLELND